MNNTNSPLYFIHISKTAGTSFRKAAEAYFTPEHTCYNYGSKSPQTHPEVLKHIHENGDVFSVGEYITKHAKFFSSHSDYELFCPFFHPKNIITFVRSPEQRVRSNFEHSVRTGAHQGSFEEFIITERFSNKQSKKLGAMGLKHLGFVGLTEDYETSLNLINSLYKTDFKLLNLNKNKAKKQSQYAFTKQELNLIHEHNKEDFALYKEACTRFQRQKMAIEASRPFIQFGLVPLTTEESQGEIEGWVTNHQSNEAQDITVLINEVKAVTLTANKYCDFVKKYNMNRKGFIGFTFSLPEGIALNDKIEFRSVPSNELLHSMYHERG